MCWCVFHSQSSKIVRIIVSLFLLSFCGWNFFHFRVFLLVLSKGSKVNVWKNIKEKYIPPCFFFFLPLLLLAVARCGSVVRDRAAAATVCADRVVCHCSVCIKNGGGAIIILGVALRSRRFEIITKLARGWNQVFHRATRETRRSRTTMSQKTKTGK